ncbi:hypothetical protein EI94DRAFT_1449497, partial [Lactarius quietus]
IPKPSGEVGRNGHGGYLLKEVLRQQGWEDELYNKIRERVCSLATEYLDTSLSYSAQATKLKSRIALICEMVRFLTSRCAINDTMQASNEFPILLEYEGNWVIHDYLHTYLKNCAQKAK